MTAHELQRVLDSKRAEAAASAQHRAWQRRRRNAEDLRARCASPAQAAAIMARGPMWIDTQAWTGIRLLKRPGGAELPLSPGAHAFVRVLASVVARGFGGLVGSARQLAEFMPGRAQGSAHAHRASVFRALSELEAAGLVNRVHQFTTAPSGARWRDANAYTLTLAAGARIRRRRGGLREVAALLASSLEIDGAGVRAKGKRPWPRPALGPETWRAEKPLVAQCDDYGAKRRRSPDPSPGSASAQAPNGGFEGMEPDLFSRTWREILRE